MLSKSIIVSGITNLSDARYCTGMGVAFLGVCADADNPNFLDLPKFNEINSWLSGINWVLETTSTDLNEIIDAHQSYATTCIYTDSAITANLSLDAGIDVILEMTDVEVGSDLSRLAGIAVTFDKLERFISLYSDALPVTQVYVTGDIQIEDLQTLRDKPEIAGVILSGGVEERPGYKNMDELIDSLEVFED